MYFFLSNTRLHACCLLQVTTAEGLGSGSINSLPIDAFHDMLPNHTESSSEEYLTNRNNMIPLKKSRSNMIRLNMINVKDDWQDSSKNAWRVASKPHIRSSRRIQLMEKTHRQCGDAEDQPVTAAIIVVRSCRVIDSSRVICVLIGYI